MPMTVILVAPKRAENVGAVARAMKTMGLSQLRIALGESGPEPETMVHQSAAAQWVAHGATDILEQATVYPHLQAAVADLDLTIASSAKPRTGKRTSHSPRQLRTQVASQLRSGLGIGLVFGREDRGLSASELAQCDILASIPLAQSYPSLNLAQAVMVFAYELAPMNLLQEEGRLAEKSPVQHNDHRDNAHQENAHRGELRQLKARVLRLYQQLEKVPGSALEQWTIENLARLQAEDIRFLHTLCLSLERGLAPEKEWP